VREIMLIASVSAKSAEMKSGIRLTSFIPKSPSSSQGNSTNLPSPQSVKSSIRRLQDGNSLVIALDLYLDDFLTTFLYGILCSLFSNSLLFWCTNSLSLFWFFLDVTLQNFHWLEGNHFKDFLRREETGTVLATFPL